MYSIKKGATARQREREKAWTAAWLRSCSPSSTELRDNSNSSLASTTPDKNATSESPRLEAKKPMQRNLFGS